MQSGANRQTRRTANADEVDAVYGRRVYCYLQRPGATSSAKRRIRRRERREGERDLRRDVREA